MWPNGIAFHGGRLYVTDSANGAIWRARLGTGVAAPTKPWLLSDELAPGDPEADPTLAGIGVNGIAFRGDFLYVSVADGARIMRVARKDGGGHGPLRAVCTPDSCSAPTASPSTPAAGCGSRPTTARPAPA